MAVRRESDILHQPRIQRDASLRFQHEQLAVEPRIRQVGKCGFDLRNCLECRRVRIAELEAAGVGRNAHVKTERDLLGQRDIILLHHAEQYLAGRRGMRIPEKPLCIMRIGNMVVDAKCDDSILLALRQIAEELSVCHIDRDPVFRCKFLKFDSCGHIVIHRRQRIGTDHTGADPQPAQDMPERIAAADAVAVR